MWLPFALSNVWWPESKKQMIEASENDLEERKIEVLFYLENLPARRLDVDLCLDKEENKVQTDGIGRKVSVQFIPGDEGRLKHVAFIAVDSNPRAAVKYCYNQLTELMSIWAIKTGSGFSIYAYRVLDIKHSAQWKVYPQTAAPEQFFIPAQIGIKAEYAAVFSLYREARNSLSPFYRFLCCYKILEAWYRHRNIFGAADRLIKKHNLPFTRLPRSIRKDNIGFAALLSLHQEFEGQRFGKAFQMLNDWRVKVAHAITDEGHFINLDDYDMITEAGAFADCADTMAWQTLQDETALWQQINTHLNK